MGKIAKPTSISSKWWKKHKPSLLPKTGVGELLKAYEKKSLEERLEYIRVDEDIRAKEVLTEIKELTTAVRNAQKVARVQKMKDFSEACEELIALLGDDLIKIRDSLVKQYSEDTSTTASKTTAEHALNQWKQDKLELEHTTKSLSKGLNEMEQDLQKATTLDQVEGLMGRAKGLVKQCATNVAKAQAAYKSNAREHKRLQPQDETLKAFVKMLSDSQAQVADAKELRALAEKFEMDVLVAGKNLAGSRAAGKKFLKASEEELNVGKRPPTREEQDRIDKERERESKKTKENIQQRRVEKEKQPQKSLGKLDLEGFDDDDV